MIETIPCFSYIAKFADIWTSSDSSFCEQLKEYYTDMMKDSVNFMFALRTPVDLCHLCRVIGKLTEEDCKSYGNL